MQPIVSAPRSLLASSHVTPQPSGGATGGYAPFQINQPQSTHQQQQQQAHLHHTQQQQQQSPTGLSPPQPSAHLMQQSPPLVSHRLGMPSYFSSTTQQQSVYQPQAQQAQAGVGGGGGGLPPATYQTTNGYTYSYGSTAYASYPPIANQTTGTTMYAAGMTYQQQHQQQQTQTINTMQQQQQQQQQSSSHLQSFSHPHSHQQLHPSPVQSYSPFLPSVAGPTSTLSSSFLTPTYHTWLKESPPMATMSSSASHPSPSSLLLPINAMTQSPQQQHQRMTSGPSLGRVGSDGFLPMAMPLHPHSSPPASGMDLAYAGLAKPPAPESTSPPMAHSSLVHLPYHPHHSHAHPYGHLAHPSRTTVGSTPAGGALQVKLGPSPITSPKQVMLTTSHHLLHQMQHPAHPPGLPARQTSHLHTVATTPTSVDHHHPLAAATTGTTDDTSSNNSSAAHGHSRTHSHSYTSSGVDLEDKEGDVDGDGDVSSPEGDHPDGCGGDAGGTVSMNEEDEEYASSANKKGSACLVCYRAKTSCDGERPCFRCCRLHKADLCVDRPLDERHPRKRKPGPYVDRGVRSKRRGLAASRKKAKGIASPASAAMADGTTTAEDPCSLIVGVPDSLLDRVKALFASAPLSSSATSPSVGPSTVCSAHEDRSPMDTTVNSASGSSRATSGTSPTNSCTTASSTRRSSSSVGPVDPSRTNWIVGYLRNSMPVADFATLLREIPGLDSPFLLGDYLTASSTDDPQLVGLISVPQHSVRSTFDTSPLVGLVSPPATPSSRDTTSSTTATSGSISTPAVDGVLTLPGVGGVAAAGKALPTMRIEYGKATIEKGKMQVFTVHQESCPPQAYHQQQQPQPPSSALMMELVKSAEVAAAEADSSPTSVAVKVESASSSVPPASLPLVAPSTVVDSSVPVGVVCTCPGSVTVNLSARLLVNPEWERLFGWCQEEIVRMIIDNRETALQALMRADARTATIVGALEALLAGQEEIFAKVVIATKWRTEIYTQVRIIRPEAHTPNDLTYLVTFVVPVANARATTTAPKATTQPQGAIRTAASTVSSTITSPSMLSTVASPRQMQPHSTLILAESATAAAAAAAAAVAAAAASTTAALADGQGVTPMDTEPIGLPPCPPAAATAESTSAPSVSEPPPPSRQVESARP